jgi:c-di-GMP-binding flagellar brake protein YcgR
MAERRRYNRLVLALPVRYQVVSGDTAGKPQGQGLLKNISLGGIYFECPPPVNIKPGEILQFTIAASLPALDIFGTSQLKARGEVLRLDHLLGVGRAGGGGGGLVGGAGGF